LLTFPVYDFTKDNAQQAAKFEIDPEKKDKKIKRTDILIAATTTIISVILGTFDRDFQELENL
jgi:predicted nucleic acid-binding protein